MKRTHGGKEAKDAVHKLWSRYGKEEISYRKLFFQPSGRTSSQGLLKEASKGKYTGEKTTPGVCSGRSATLLEGRGRTRAAINRVPGGSGKKKKRKKKYRNIPNTPNRGLVPGKSMCHRKLQFFTQDDKDYTETG